MTSEIETSSAALRSQIVAMAGYGVSAEDIALALGLELEVLTSTYSHDLASAPIKANAKVAERLYRMALGDGREAVTAAIFWLKTRARWKETHAQEIHGKLDSTWTFVTTYEDSKIL